MKEKMIQVMKTHKHLIGIVALVICLAVAAIISIGFLIHPDSKEKTTSKRPTTERVVMGPKTSVLAYHDFENLDEAMPSPGNNANTIERVTEGEKSYAKMSYVTNAYCAYAPKFSGVDLSDTMMLEMSLSTDGSPIPDAVVSYPYDRNTTNPNFRKNFVEIRKDGSIVVESTTLEGVETTVATLEPGKWVRLGIKFTPADGRYIVFIYNETTGTWEQKAINVNTPSVVSPSFIRLQIATGAENVGTSILFDDVALYTASTFVDHSELEVIPAITVTTGPDVEMDHPEMADIGSDGVVVMSGKDYAYVGEEKITLSKASTETTIGEETSGFKAFLQSIINFFKKLFGMTVEEPVTYEDILVSGEFIQKYLKIDVKDTSETYAIGELAKEAGKNVVYDDRGLIVVTNSDIELDAEDDVKLLTMLYGLFETGEVVWNYAAAPIFDQESIDHAINTYAAKFPEAYINRDAATKNATALYYLTLISRYYPDAKHSIKDITVVDSALNKLRVFINGGGEPFASAGPYFGHGIVSSCFTLIKNTDVIYSQLTEDEIDRMDTIMAALAIAGNWQYNDANEYTTSYDLQGNLHDSANYRNAYLTTVLNASLYFGPEKLNEIFVNFNYDTYMAKFEEYGFTNIYNKWVDIGYNNAKELMEQGGDAYLIGQNGDYYASTVGNYAGTGKGVKLPFNFNGFGTEDVLEIFSEYQIAYTYEWKTISEYGTPGTASHCYIMSDNKTSPMEGQMGMMAEYATTDSGDIRSRNNYVFYSFQNLIPLYTNMKLLCNWDSSTQRMRELDNRIWVGNEDFIYKMIEGYHGRSIGENYEEYEYTFTPQGYEYLKDIWYNFHCMQNKEITLTEDPEKIALGEIPEAEPKEGDGITPPEGAWVAHVKGRSSIMRPESFYRFIEGNKGYESGKVEFEFVIPDGIDPDNYNVVVMLDQQDKGRKYADFNILFQLMSGSINVYNGAASVSDYIPTGLRFGPNYRFHVEWEWDVANTCSKIKITQTWPETQKEVSYTSKKLKFRATGDSIQGINSLVLVQNDVGSPFWVEDFKLVETGKIVDVMQSEPDLVRIPGAYYQNDFNDEERKTNYNANNRGYNNEISLVWNAGTKNGWLNMKIASEDQAYFRPKIKGARANETLVMELELSTDSKTANGYIMYPYKASLEAEKTSNNTMINIKDNKLTSGGKDIATLSPGKWTRIGIIFTPATGQCTIYEYNQSTGVYERRVERELNPSVIAPTYVQFYVSSKQKIGNNTLVDDISIYEGTEFYFDKKIDTTGVYVKSTKKKNIATPDGYYYWSDYNVENCNVKYDAQIKSKSGYDYTQGLDSNGNGYMSIDSIDGMTTGSFFRAKVEGATNGDYIITEIDLRAGQNGTPGFSLMYDYNKVDGSTKAKSFFTVSKGNGRVIGGNALISSLSSSKWTKIGVILNQKTGDYTVYEYDETTKTYVWKTEGSGGATQEGYPTFVGLNISAPSSPSSVHVDNFFVYGSNEASFKDGTTGTKPPFDGIYYSQDYSDVDLWDVGVKFYNGGGNDYTRMVDTDGNAYVKMTSKKDSNEQDYFRVNLNEISEDPNGSIVVEMALRAGKDGVPDFGFNYEPEAGKTKTVFNAKRGSFQLLGTGVLLSNLSSDEWTRIGMILNLETGKYTLYEYDKASSTYVWKEEGTRKLEDGYPTWMRFYFGARTEASSCSLDLDNYKIYSGTAFADAITGVKPEFDGTYYSQDYNVEKFITADATMKSTSGYDFTQGMDADGNGYLKVTSKEGVNGDSYFRADVSGVSEEDSIVAELKLRAGEAGTPKLSFMFNRTTAGHGLFSVADSGDRAYKGDTTIAPITKDSWTQLGVILNRETGEYTIYRNVGGTYVAMTTGSTDIESGKPTWFGFSIGAPGQDTREFHLDDFTIYAGTEFRKRDITDVSDENIEVIPAIFDNVLPTIASTNTPFELFNYLLSYDEQSSVMQGEKAVLTLNVSRGAENSDDKNVVTNALDGRAFGEMFVLNLTKQIGEETTQVTSTSEMVTFTIGVPESVKNINPDYTRNYEIIRVSEGVATTLESRFDAENNTITFSTDKISTFAIVYKDNAAFVSYMEDFNDAKTLIPTLKSSSAQRYEDDYSEQIAAYARAHGTTNDATKQDFYGKKTDGDNSYLYMRSTGKLTSNNPYYTSFTFSNISVDIGEKPLWIEMDLKALEQRVNRYNFYVNGTQLFNEKASNGIKSTNLHALGESEFNRLSLKFVDGQCYAYINGADEIALGEFALEELESFEIQIYPDGADVIETGNAGICIDNVAVYTRDTRIDLFKEPTITLNKTEITSMEIGTTEQLTANVETIGTVPTVTWSSSDETVATVSSDGLVTAVGNGQVVITAKAGNLEATCVVIVGVSLSDSIAYMEDFNDAKTLIPTLKSSSAQRYEDDYSEQIAVYARAHGTTNDATKQDFYGKKTDGDNSYLYMRSTGKLTSNNPYYTSFTFSNISVDIGEKPLWIEMDLKALEQRVNRYNFYVNGIQLFNEKASTGIKSTNLHALGESEFNKLSLKFVDGQCYAYINGADEIALGEFALEELESFEIKIYPDGADVIETGNAGICIDNVAVYAKDSRVELFGDTTTGVNRIAFINNNINLMSKLMLFSKTRLFQKL